MATPILEFSLTPEPAQADPGLMLDDVGQLRTLDGICAIRQSILLLLSTRPGERAMQPEYGCALDRLVFEPNDETTAGIAIRLVSAAIARFEPLAQIVSVDAHPNPDLPATLIVSIQFQDRNSGASDTLDLAVRLDEGEGTL